MRNTTPNLLRPALLVPCDKPRKLLDKWSDFTLRDQLKTLEARLAIRAGEYDRAYKLLRKSVLRRGDRASTGLFAVLGRSSVHPTRDTEGLPALAGETPALPALAGETPALPAFAQPRLPGPPRAPTAAP